MKWHEIRSAGVARIDRVVAEFDVWVDESLPFARFRVKVIERFGVDFHASINVAIKNKSDGQPEFVGGLGNSIEEALQDALRRFQIEIDQNRPNRDLSPDDFYWSAPEDF